MHAGCRLDQIVIILALAATVAHCNIVQHQHSNLPIVINTWPFTEATDAAWSALTDLDSTTPALDAVEIGCTTCEDLQCDYTVGYGGSPDESGETTLDALIMDGTAMTAGAVATLRHVKEAARAARLVMERTTHTLLGGFQASQFAVEMGLKPSDLTTNHSHDVHEDWLNGHCQPNFRQNVKPNPRYHCGPYHLPAQQPLTPCRKSNKESCRAATEAWPTRTSHDTIAMVAIDIQGNIAAGASSNGATHKVPGRVGDAAVPGGGAYADSEVGGCGSTGDGDTHLRFLPCYQVVESMRQGLSVQAAVDDAIRRMARKAPLYVGALVALDKHGNIGAACYGWRFSFTYRDVESDGHVVVEVDPLVLEDGTDNNKAGGSLKSHSIS